MSAQRKEPSRDLLWDPGGLYEVAFPAASPGCPLNCQTYDGKYSKARIRMDNRDSSPKARWAGVTVRPAPFT
jgi:hypothetical protein